MHDLRQRVEAELKEDILPFWLKYAVDEENGGFRGRIANDLTIDPRAEKGIILNARILWTFARAYSVYRERTYLTAARRAYDYITRCFWDYEFGGVYWMVDYLGKPADTKKRIYAQAFTVYALAEYYEALGDGDAIRRAMQLVERMEAIGHDGEHGGYFETYERDWTPAADQRLSEVDQDDKKSMNTHLHMLEAYAGLLRVYDEDRVRQRLKELIEVFLDRIVDPANHHLILFFDEAWRRRSDKISFGHDIECSWLLHEAAEILGDTPLVKRVRDTAAKMAQAVYSEGLDTDGGLLYEASPAGMIDTSKQWWPQAEAVVGFLNAYQITGQRHFMDAAEASWEFIEKYIVDRERGEWYWLVSKAGVPDAEREKVGTWKCPYHNSRTCFEVMARLDGLALGKG